MKVCTKPCTLPVATLQSFNGLQNIHKTGTSLGLLYLAGVQLHIGWLRSLLRYQNHWLGKSYPSYAKYKGLVNKAKVIILLPEECLCSYHFTALFTSVPVDPAFNIIKDLLEKDDKLWDRTVLSEQNIIELLGFFLHTTYFFQNRFYEQVGGESMGSPVSSIVANLYMEHSEKEALWSASNPPGIGLG